MFRHTVLMKLKPGVSEDEVEAILGGLATLPKSMDFIRRYEFGRDLGKLDGAFDLAIVADFDSESDYRRYAENPDHMTVIADRIRPVLEHLARVQYLVD